MCRFSRVRQVLTLQMLDSSRGLRPVLEAFNSLGRGYRHVIILQTLDGFSRGMRPVMTMLQAFDSFSRGVRHGRLRAAAVAEACCVRLGLAKREGHVTSLRRAGQLAAWALVVLLLTSIGVGLVATAHHPTQVWGGCTAPQLELRVRVEI